MMSDNGFTAEGGHGAVPTDGVETTAGEASVAGLAAV